MKKYHKIQTVYKRDPENNFKTLLEGEYSLPEFEYLKDNEWVFTEKVDGTNIRVMFNSENSYLEFRGKTDKAQMQPVLLPVLPKLFPAIKLKSIFDDTPVCLYGEGYGPKIQKGGVYRDDVSFVLFDVQIGRWWLERSAVEEIADRLGVDIVPIIGRGTLCDMINIAKDGFNSTWGEFIAEGIVARPIIELKARNGGRIITKIKYKDFV
jgi:hypothetical protein